MKYLVVVADPREATHLPDDVDIVLCGIGKVDAAIATTAALARLSPQELVRTTVVNLGSCGALRPGLNGVYEPGVVLNHDISADAIRALGHDPHECISLPSGDERIILATGDLFVADTTVRDQLAERASLVDMEGYSVVRAAQAFHVPVRLVKHVSDDADAGALDWAQLVERSARDLGHWWAEHLSAASGDQSPR